MVGYEPTVADSCLSPRSDGLGSHALCSKADNERSYAMRDWKGSMALSSPRDYPNSTPGLARSAGQRQKLKMVRHYRPADSARNLLPARITVWLGTRPSVPSL